MDDENSRDLITLLRSWSAGAIDPIGDFPHALSVDLPATHYARTTDGYVGYQLVGSGSSDIVLVSESAQNIDVMWERPLIASCLHRLASLGRLICYDRRGSGISDNAPRGAPPSLEHGVDDTLAVLDAAGSRRAVVFGEGNAGPVAIMFAATYPERTQALILINSYSRFLRDVDYPWGLPTDRVPRLLSLYERAFGSGDTALVSLPRWHRTKRSDLSGADTSACALRRVARSRCSALT